MVRIVLFVWAARVARSKAAVAVGAAAEAPAGSAALGSASAAAAPRQCSTMVRAHCFPAMLLPFETGAALEAGLASNWRHFSSRQSQKHGRGGWGALTSRCCVSPGRQSQTTTVENGPVRSWGK